jgi:hypothetical protein
VHRADARRRHRALTLALLAACQTLFLWMFLATDPLEQVAWSASPRNAGVETVAAALRFAADWRHGMRGNAWLYMPGFFGVAAALWLHARTAPLRFTAFDTAVACASALAAAALGSAAGARDAMSAFVLAERLPMPATLPQPSFQAVCLGVYTLTTWSVFVVASRQALITRSLRPFALPAIMSVLLALVRPLTVDDCVSLWRERALAGDPIACGSLVLGGVVIALLIASEEAGGRSPKPQPGQPELPLGQAPGAHDEQQIRRRHDRVEAGRRGSIQQPENQHDPETEVGRARQALG